MLVQRRAIERRERQSQSVMRAAPVDQAFADFVTQFARLVLAFLDLVLARTSIEVVLAVPADEPVVTIVAAQGVIAGAYDVAVAAGVEVMTRTPMGASVVQGMGFPFPQEQVNDLVLIYCSLILLGSGQV